MEWSRTQALVREYVVRISPLITTEMLIGRLTTLISCTVIKRAALSLQPRWSRIAYCVRANSLTFGYYNVTRDITLATRF